MDDINRVSGIIVDVAYQIHTMYGPGMLESVYEKLLAYELRKRGLNVKTQVYLPIVHEELEIPDAFRLDLIVNDCIIVEVKSQEHTTALHTKQLLTYLKLTDMKLGLLLNFGKAYMKDGIERVANNLPST